MQHLLRLLNIEVREGSDSFLCRVKLFHRRRSVLQEERARLGL